MVAANEFSLFALFTAGLAALVRADDGPTANAVRLPGLGDVCAFLFLFGAMVLAFRREGTTVEIEPPADHRA